MFVEDHFFQTPRPTIHLDRDTFARLTTGIRIERPIQFMTYLKKSFCPFLPFHWVQTCIWIAPSSYECISVIGLLIISVWLLLGYLSSPCCYTSIPRTNHQNADCCVPSGLGYWYLSWGCSPSVWWLFGYFLLPCAATLLRCRRRSIRVYGHIRHYFWRQHCLLLLLLRWCTAVDMFYQCFRCRHSLGVWCKIC